MYQLITSKGRKSADTLEALAEWLLDMQPSSTRIVWGDIEAEVEWTDDDCEQDLRWALRLAEAETDHLVIRAERVEGAEVKVTQATLVRSPSCKRPKGKGSEKVVHVIKRGQTQGRVVEV